LDEKTQQRILTAIDQVRSDLTGWLRGEGWSEAEIMPLFRAVMNENGLFAAVILEKSSRVLQLEGVATVQAAQVAQAIAQLISGEFAESLLHEPQPTPEQLVQLDQLLLKIKNALPNLRQHLLASAKNGPRYKRGGRPKEIDDPAERAKIREAIKSLRDPGIRVQDLDRRFARKYGVSPTAIKRIRLEKKMTKNDPVDVIAL
jgi:hypothetical protein